MNEHTSTLLTNGLSFSYGNTVALKNVSIDVPAGQFVALLGANGAGKSTLFSIVTGLYAAHAGSVVVTGHDLRKQTLAALAGMGVVFQRTTLDTDLTVAQNLRYAAALQGIARSEAKARIEKSLQNHSLIGMASRKITALSGGQRRRVELARALLHRPKLLLLDEPTVGLDLQSREEFVTHVKQLCQQQGTGVLWATHLMDEVSDHDRAYVLHRGEIIAQGKVSALLAEHDAANVSALFNSLVEGASSASAAQQRNNLSGSA